MTEGFGHPTDIGGDDRKTAGQSLGDDHAVRLGARREHHQVCRGVAAVELGSRPRSREGNAVAEAVVQRAVTEPSNEGRVAVQAAHAHALPGQVHYGRQRTEQHVVTLAGGHRRDAKQGLTRRGPGCEIGGVDAGLGDVHPLGGQPVQLEQPAAAPFARRDDGGGSREDRPFPPVLQRHVNEHDQAQPVRLRHQHVGGR